MRANAERPSGKDRQVAGTRWETSGTGHPASCAAPSTVTGSCAEPVRAMGVPAARTPSLPSPARQEALGRSSGPARAVPVRSACAARAALCASARSPRPARGYGGPSVAVLDGDLVATLSVVGGPRQLEGRARGGAHGRDPAARPSASGPASDPSALCSRSWREPISCPSAERWLSLRAEVWQPRRRGRAMVPKPA